MSLIAEYVNYLYEEEKSAATIEKYLRSVRAFFDFLGGRKMTKDVVCQYKYFLKESGYAARTINAMLAAVHSLLKFLGTVECCVRTMRVQKKIYCDGKSVLTMEEYLKMLQATEHDEQLNLILQTLASTGIRVSELDFFTVEAVYSGRVEVHCKGKVRVILLHSGLCRMLLAFAKACGIEQGYIFRSSQGKALNRSVLWRRMKRAAEHAGVAPEKVFPHNFRRFFARCMYEKDKDLAKLADLLGHSSIETTRIYIMDSGQEHQKKLEQLGLIIPTYCTALEDADSYDAMNRIENVHEMSNLGAAREMFQICRKKVRKCRGHRRNRTKERRRRRKKFEKKRR